jgi:hypothetical protein
MEEIKQLLNIQKNLQEKFKESNRKFTISGNIVGDIGEVLAAEKYRIELYPENYPNYDAFEKVGRKRKIQIKTSLQGKCYIHKDFIPEHFLSIYIEDGIVKELYNGPGQYLFDNYAKDLTPNPRGYYTLAPGKLKALNKEVPPKDKIQMNK